LLAPDNDGAANEQTNADAFFPRFPASASHRSTVSKSVVAKMPAMPKKAVLSAAVTSLASQALPALAVVDERLNGDGTGLIFGINDESLGFILLTVPVLIFGLYYVANTTDASIMAGGKDDDSGLTL
jgi:photosystem II PsbW protein